MEWETFSSPTPWPSSTSDLLAITDEETSTVAFPGGRRSSEDPWFGYVEGYRLAAEAVLRRVEETSLDQDSWVFPFLMCWRHYVELHLKSLINLIQRGLHLPIKTPPHHKIDKLWREAIALFDQVNAFGEDDKKTTQHVERLVLQLHELDPSAQEARYPITTKGSPTLAKILYLDMRTFHNAMEGVANFFTGSDVGLTEHFRVREEIAREMSQGDM